MTMPSTDSADASRKERIYWTIEQTDALVNAWKEAFIELQSHKSPQSWKRTFAVVNKAGNQKEV